MATKEVVYVKTIPQAKGQSPRGVQDGARITAQRRAMVTDCRFISRRTAFREGRSPATCISRVRGRNSVGVAHRSALARSTCALSFTANVLASIPSLDRGWIVEGGLGATAAQARSPWLHRLARSHGRRHVFLGKKRGLCVGKTKRGKGT